MTLASLTSTSASANAPRRSRNPRRRRHDSPPVKLALADRLFLSQHALFHPDPNVVRRAEILMRLGTGVPIGKIADLLGVSRDTIRHTRDKYQEIGLQGALADRRLLAFRRLRPWLLPARTLDILDLAELHSNSGTKRLDISDDTRALLLHTARNLEVLPEPRYWAAILTAYDRGAPVSAIARAACTDRSVICKAPNTHLRDFTPAP